MNIFDILSFVRPDIPRGFMFEKYGREKKTKYSGADLREIRVRNGVGRPPKKGGV